MTSSSRGGGPALLQAGEVGQRRRLVRQPARQELVGDDAERVHVRGRAGRLAARLLGRQVGGGAEHGADLGDVGLLGRLGDAEVGELDHAVAAAQQVAGLDVAVDDLVAVRVGEPAARLGEDLDRLVGGQRAALAQDLRARLPVDVLHDDEVAVRLVVEPEVEDLDDVGVHEPGGGQRLALEARHEARVVGQVLGQQLDRHVALQPRVERQLDGGHAADAEAALEPVAVGEELVGHPPSSSGAGAPPAPPSVGVSVGAGVSVGSGVARLGRLGRRASRSARASRSRSAPPSESRSASPPPRARSPGRCAARSGRPTRAGCSEASHRPGVAAR